jgi:hypothetical protein
VKKAMAPGAWAVRHGGGNRGGGGEARLDPHCADPAARRGRLAEMAVESRALTEEWARMERDGYVRTTADAFAPLEQRWVKP